VVQFLQYEVREGREAREAGAVVIRWYSKLRWFIHFVVWRWLMGLKMKFTPADQEDPKNSSVKTSG